jgi:lysozyme family protein
MDFNSSLTQVLKEEGGYVNDPNDPGGETNLGISKRAFPNLDIKSLTVADVAPIYKREYWDTISADSLPSPINYLAFDCAVNQGPATARTFLAVSRDPYKFTMMRLNRYRANANWGKYGQGWINRIVSGLCACIS